MVTYSVSPAEGDPAEYVVTTDGLEVFAAETPEAVADRLSGVRLRRTT